MNIDEQVPSFYFNATDGLAAQLSDYRGKWVILYFYPKDATPGCTTEGQDFRDHFQQFQKHNAVIFGISRDSLKAHERFKCKEAFPFPLISDPDETLCTLFEVMKNKNMYGKSVRGIERSTFLIDPQGFLRKEWRKVSVPGHVKTVLTFLESQLP